MIEERPIGLEEALRLSADFSARSSNGGVPESTLIPVPREVPDEFDAMPWGQVGQEQREAFRRFYQRVGDAVEEAANRLRDGGDVDDADWAAITSDVRATG